MTWREPNPGRPDRNKLSCKKIGRNFRQYYRYEGRLNSSWTTGSTRNFQTALTYETCEQSSEMLTDLVSVSL